MDDHPPTRPLPERTGKHLCIQCLGAVPVEEYFRNDHICDACAAKDQYTLASTPEPRKKK